MSNQIPMFGPPPRPRKKRQSGLARNTDPESSKLAAKNVRTETLRALIVRALRDNLGGLTTAQIAVGTGRSLVSISPRMKPLQREGIVVDDGTTRKNSSGAWAIVWKLTTALWNSPSEKGK